MHVMLNVKALGKRPDAAIIQIGAVLFEAKSGGKLYNGRGFNRHVLVQDGVGTIDHGTLCFWLGEKSAPKMGLDLSTKADPLSIVLADLVGWLKIEFNLDWNAIEGVWSKGADFDLPVIRLAFNRLGLDVPWDGRAGRCVRTLFSLTGEPEIDWTGFTHHDALDDAIGQAMQVQIAMGRP